MSAGVTAAKRVAILRRIHQCGVYPICLKPS